MKINKLLLVSVIIFLQFTICYSQNNNLTLSQMLQDFDQTINHINIFAVHKDLNSIRLQIDYDKAYQALRNEITETTTDCEFRAIIGRAIGLVQDAHCTYMDSQYLMNYGKYQKKINFTDEQTFERVTYYENKCDEASVNLNLPLLYKGGKYYVYSDFIYKGNLIKQNTEVTKYNNIEIADHIKANYDNIGIIRWDHKLKIPYRDSFYRNGDDKFKLDFNNAIATSLTFSLQDSITYLEPQQRNVYFGSQSKKQVLYFEDSKMLYIGIPFMDAELGEAIVKDIDSIHAKGKPFAKIVIDVRGNGGGNDMCYRSVIQHLISEDIPFESELKFKYNEPAVTFYAEDQKKIEYQNISLLNNQSYWTKNYDINKIEPDANTIGYSGRIYVLQDKFIFSSASNLSNLCLNSDQLISVGETTDLVGGRQTEPLFIQLINSGLVFRVEPMLDFSGVKTINDFSHNEVEVRITPNIEDYFLRTTYKGDVYSSEFLLKHDKLIRFVLSQ